MNRIAHEFLARSFAPGSTIALLLRKKNPAKTQQRVVTLEQTLAPRYLGWLAYENHHGANVYVAANPLRSGSRKRTKESIASIRHIYLDIDEEGGARLAALRTSSAVPPATVILSTSPGKYQILWQVRGFGFQEQEATLKRLAQAFGGDLACTDCNRVLRVPGFLNCKYSPAPAVAAEYGQGRAWEPSDFLLESVPDRIALPLRGSTRSATHKDTRSEQDWAWVCEQLAHGEDAAKLERELAVRRSDKANPVYYAQRTIDVASARQWFLEGVPVDSVIERLFDRRRLELPAALCSARAREIAATAQRLAARRKIG